MVGLKINFSGISRVKNHNNVITEEQVYSNELYLLTSPFDDVIKKSRGNGNRYFTIFV